MLSHSDRKVVSPAGAVEHLREIRKEKLDARKQVQAFVAGIPLEDDYSTVRLPADGLAPQPVIPVVDGFQCRIACTSLRTVAGSGSMQTRRTARRRSRTKI